MKLEEIQHRLRWHCAKGVDLNKIEGFGLLLKDKDGDIHEVGEYNLSDTEPNNDDYCYVYDAGCGCCADRLDFIEYAFLSEYIKSVDLEEQFEYVEC